MSFSRGDFSFVPPSERYMLEDAFKAVTVNKAWEEMGKDPGGGGFMFSKPSATMQKVYSSMTYEGHSGASHAWTMRVMQAIAQDGWEAYVKGHELRDIEARQAKAARAALQTAEILSANNARATLEFQRASAAAADISNF